MNVKSFRRKEVKHSMGKKLKEYRTKQNVTQEELARRSGVSRQTISSIENDGIGAATTKTLSKIAEALDTTVAKLFFEETV